MSIYRMALDPRIVAIIGCGFLMLVGVSIPDELDVAKKLKTDLEQSYKNYDWCGDNVQCQKTAQTSMKSLETSLNAIEMRNNIRLVFFWGGLLGAIGSGVSLGKSH